MKRVLLLAMATAVIAGIASAVMPSGTLEAISIHSGPGSTGPS